ncbi:MAG: ATP-binding protein [Candidatus Electrothrix sp. Rat3]|nr:ATP-binding protein [Candidatus Electrothrix rattekaaiensis]
MLARNDYLHQLEKAVRRSPVTSLLGPRQCGKTTLARFFSKNRQSRFFDLESRPDQQRLQNPEMVLGNLTGLVVLDEIQIQPDLFSVLRVLVDRPDSKARFLILGSASPQIIKHASETLAGRAEFIELAGFDLTETGPESMDQLWVRGGFPRSYLAENNEDSEAWRQGFIRSFLERDIPQLGINVPATAMRRFWTMLAHFHGQTWNGSELGRSLGVSDKTVRSYLDILTGTFMVRQLQPWHENIKKRQVKSPKVYFRDSGLLHSLLSIPDSHALFGHPRCGASWEGFALEQILRIIRPEDAYFWATHSGAELDLFFLRHGKRFGVEFKLNEAPRITKSMHVALEDLKLDHLWVVYPGKESYPVHERITVAALASVEQEFRSVLPGS